MIEPCRSTGVNLRDHSARASGIQEETAMTIARMAALFALADSPRLAQTTAGEQANQQFEPAFNGDAATRA